MKKVALVLALSTLALLILVLNCFLVRTKPRYELYIWEEHQLNEQRAQAIESALEEYRELHGRYPESLDDLVPDLMDSVPVTVTGDGFEYHAHILPYSGAPDYTLYYYPASSPNIVCGRNSLYSQGYWDCSLKNLGDIVE